MRKLMSILIWIVALTNLGSAAEFEEELSRMRIGVNASQSLTSVWKRGGFHTRRIQHNGVSFTFQEGRQGANWAQLNITGKEIEVAGLRVKASPSVIVHRENTMGYGASIDARLDDIVSLSHTSHFGGTERHLTRLTLAPKSAVKVQAMRLDTGKSVTTRVGPSVSLGKNSSIWYGVATDGSPNLLLFTSNLRF